MILYRNPEYRPDPGMRLVYDKYIHGYNTNGGIGYWRIAYTWSKATFPDWEPIGNFKEEE